MPSVKRALAEQQVLLEAQAEAIDAIASLAGVDITAIKTKAVRRIATLRSTADTDNPANPVPQPAPAAPFVTTEEAKTPEATTDVTTPAAAPVATTDVPADANTSVMDTGTVLDEPLTLSDDDPTKPVAGATEPNGPNKVEPNIEVGNPAKTDTMFPMQGPFTDQPKVSSGTRTFASIRLARLRVKAGIVPDQDDLTLGTSIATSQMTDEQISSEIDTLDKVVAKQQTTTKPVSNRLVPRAASGQRSAPSMTAAASLGNLPSMEPTSDETEALW